MSPRASEFGFSNFSNSRPSDFYRSDIPVPRTSMCRAKYFDTVHRHFRPRWTIYPRGVSGKAVRSLAGRPCGFDVNACRVALLILIRCLGWLSVAAGGVPQTISRALPHGVSILDTSAYRVALQ